MPALVDLVFVDEPVARGTDDSVGRLLPGLQGGQENLLSAANAAADRTLSGDPAAFLEQSRQQHGGE